MAGWTTKGSHQRWKGPLQADKFEGHADTPVNNRDIANKKYVDDTAGSPIVTHASTTGQTEDDHHDRLHNFNNTSDHNPIADTTEDNILIADGNGYPIDSEEPISDVIANTTHRGDNSQAHTDYLKNNADDITAGTITKSHTAPSNWITFENTSDSNHTYTWRVTGVASEYYLGLNENYSGTTRYPFKIYPDGVDNVLVLRDGFVGIRDVTPSYELDVNGDIRATGDYYSSDGSQGWTGTFTNGDAATVTVKNGIITGVA